MLVLINGITGNIGSAVATSLLSRGHQVRGLGRNSQKLPSSLSSKLESFVTATSWYDTAAHDKACAGVDAIVNASAALPELMLDQQLLILRAAERAGVKILVAVAWNYNWTKTKFGEHESYDHLIMFKAQTELSSTIKPIYVFTGILAEFWFKTTDHLENIPENGAWDVAKGSGMYFGDGKLRHQLTTFRDAGEYTAELVVSKNAAEGGTFEVMSFGADVWEMKEAYERVTGKKMDLARAGSIEDLRTMAVAAKNKGTRNKYTDYIGLWYLLYTVDGHWCLDEKHLWISPTVKPQSLTEHFEEHKSLFDHCPNKAS